jgi:hypothetical protein
MGKNRRQASLTNVVQYDSNFNLSIGTSPSSSFNSSGSIIAASGFTGSLSGSVFGLGNTVSFSSSVSSDLINLESKSASVDISISSINTFTASNANTSLNLLTGSLATTGSNTFYGTQVFSGSVFIATDLIVQGSSSIQYISASSVSIGTNIVQLNTATPSVRYAGISVQDSGSSAGVTGSMLWDSLCNRWIYSNPSTIGYSGGMLISGPRAANLGEETTLTCNYIAKSGGGDHLYDSCIQDSNGTVTIGGTLCTSGIICSANLEVKQGSNNRLVIDCVNSANEPRISSLDASNNPQYLTINSYDLKINTNGSRRLFIDSNGISCFSGSVCMNRLYVENSAGQASIFRQTDATSYSSLRLYNDQGTGARALEIDYMGSSYSGGERAEIFVTGAYPLLLGTSNTCRMFISNTGITSFTCQTCSPQFITTQGSSVSYVAGTNYTIWNSEIENCIQDSNNPAAYTRIKTWIADRSGCATIRYTGYIQSGPTYWGYRVTRNGTSSYMCVAYSDCIQPGCAAANVHGYSSYQFNVGPFLPGDCIGLDVVSTGGGATPSVGQGQWIFAKEFRVFSSTPNLSAGTAGNVFGEWVGIGTCTPFSNLYINSNNSALYDSTVDNGQDGCGVTMTIRNNSTITNSFAQLNLQVSGDSGRAVGRIALIRRDSASSHMAFVIETANSKIEVMRMGCFGASSHNFIMVGRTNAGISAGTGITLNATTGQIESSVNGDDILNLNRNVSDGKIIRLFKNCIEVGSISTNANSLPSDINFKTNINNLDLGLNLVNKLRPVSYNHKIDDSGSALSTGFIAQEMQCVLDELGIERNKYFILQHKPVEYQNESQYWVDYTKMIPVLTKAIQEQQCTINLLKSCAGIV